MDISDVEAAAAALAVVVVLLREVVMQKGLEKYLCYFSLHLTNLMVRSLISQPRLSCPSTHMEEIL